MGDNTSHDHSPKQAHGIFRYAVPDLSISAYNRALFAPPANKEVIEHSLPLHDARTDTTLMSGRVGLDTHGFTYVKHRSCLSESGDPATDWYTGNNVEEKYFPELIKLVCDLTGAKTAVINNVAFRRRLADKQVDVKWYGKRGDQLDQELAQLPRDVTLVYGKEEGLSLEPLRIAHIDYTLQGLKNTIRHCRHDITSAAQSSITAEDDQSSTTIPRYAAFTIWRPIRPVRRDPLAVLDIQSIEPDQGVPATYRALSDINKSGEYMMELASVLPPKNPQAQKWYWMPEQKEDEVLVVKFADTGVMSGDNDGSGNGIKHRDYREEVMGGLCGIGGTPHLSPIIEGTENEEARISIEARVLAFW